MRTVLPCATHRLFFDYQISFPCVVDEESLLRDYYEPPSDYFVSNEGKAIIVLSMVHVHTYIDAHFVVYINKMRIGSCIC